MNFFKKSDQKSLIFVFINMNIPLGIGDADTFGIESLFKFFAQVKINAPVITGLGPWPDGKVHTAVCEFGNGNHGAGFFDMRASCAMISAIIFLTLWIIRS